MNAYTQFRGHPWNLHQSRLSDRARAAGIEAIILSPTLDDFNEDLRWLGVHELRAAIVPQLASEDVARFFELSA
jgi:hypothetical protein